MHLKKKATVLISTVIILSLMSMLGCFLFKMMKNNIELSNLNNFDKDIYDLDIDEEKILYEFMKELNKERKENLKNIAEENDDIFSEDFEKKTKDSTLKYEKNNDQLFLTTNNDNNIIRKREILYIFKEEKIILIPTYKFKYNSE